MSRSEHPIGDRKPLGRAAIAMIVAHASFAGMDREKFAEFAEKGRIYQQRLWNDPDVPRAFFVLGEGDESLSVVQLTGLATAEPLVVAVPADGLNLKMLSLLWLLDTMRQGIYGKAGMQVHVVSEVGKDDVTGEARYENWEFWDLAELVSTVNSFPSKNRKMFLENVQGKCSWVTRPGGAVRLSNALIKKSLNAWKPKGITLSEVRERMAKVKQLCPPGEPDYSATTDIEKDIQTNIDVLNQGKATSAEQQTKSDSS